MKCLFVLLFCATALTGCAVTTHYQNYPDIDALANGVAFVHVAREKSAWGAAITAPVYVDRYLIARLGPGGHVTTEVPLGKVHVTATTADIVVATKKDQHYYFEVTMPAQMWIYAPDFNVKHIEAARMIEILGFDPGTREE